MRNPNRSRRSLVATVCALSTLVLTAPASADWIGQYFNAVVGTVWTFENVDEPGLYKTESVFGSLVYEGDPAVLLGADIYDYRIVQSTGRVITVYAETEDSVLVDFPTTIVISEFTDGTVVGFCPFGAPCDSSLIRIWTEVDPGLRGIYGMNPGVTDLIVIASYDSAYNKNLHNTVLESNLPGGVLPPTGAVTGVEWYQWRTGLYGELDVDAASGGFGEYWRLVDFVTAVGDDAPPAVARLDQNVPNPFNPLTRIPFALTDDVAVRLTVFDLRGHLVATLAEGYRPGAGTHVVDWDGRDQRRQPMPGGVYFYRLEAGSTITTRPMVLVR